MNNDLILTAAAMLVVLAPSILVAILAIPMLLGIPTSEALQGKLIRTAVMLGLAASVVILAIMLVSGSRHVMLEPGDWVHIHEEHYHFHIKFVFDRLSVPFVILSWVLCGTVGAFANVYLHREQGFRRFFLLYAIFQLGMIISALAGTIETLFFGWELVGLSSAFLIAFFHERPGPVRNGHRVWAIYRVSDAAFLLAALILHRLSGAGDFDALTGTGVWPLGVAAVDSWQATLVGLLLLLAAAGKSGMIPFSGWLPRAMEGPTPSSAVFYGALSVHLGTYLLLRSSPLLEVSQPLRIAVIILGLSSAVLGSLLSRVQTDVKNALAFASLTQVGIITVEIGLGFRYIALTHMIGHACLRTLQLLRAPSVLKDFHSIENAVGRHLSPEAAGWNSLLPASLQVWLYRFSLERGYLDGFLNELIVRPFTAIFRWCDQQEHRWSRFVDGNEFRESESLAVRGDSLEDVI